MVQSLAMRKQKQILAVYNLSVQRITVSYVIRLYCEYSLSFWCIICENKRPEFHCLAKHLSCNVLCANNFSDKA